MPDHIVVLRTDAPYSFVADSCATLAEAVNAPRAWCVSDDQLVATYAAMVRAYAGLLRSAIDSEVRRAIIDHLLERLGQAERGERPTPVVDVVDRLHGELVREPAVP